MIILAFLLIIPVAVSFNHTSGRLNLDRLNLGARSGLSKGIIFGSPALPKQIPWIAMLKIMDYSVFKYMCQISLISSLLRFLMKIYERTVKEQVLAVLSSVHHSETSSLCSSLLQQARRPYRKSRIHRDQVQFCEAEKIKSAHFIDQ